MQVINKLYLRFTWLSGDVVLGSMAGMLFFDNLLQADVYWQAYALLGMAVWCIYTADHLMDVRNMERDSIEERRTYHVVYSKPLFMLMLTVGLGGLFWAVLFFGITQKLVLGAGLALLILGIMLAIRKFAAKHARLKELSSAVFYVIGISWLPYYRTPPIDWTATSIGLTVLYMGLAYLNLIMLSSLDSESDKEAGFSSIATLIPQEKLLPRIRNLAVLLISLALLGLILLNSFYRIFPTLLLMMLLLHYLSFFTSGLKREQIRRRMEACFMIPLLLLLF